jgi:uncharacterized membrane protein YdbT with pleckstrin-like domain
MGYVTENLMAGEQVVYQTRLHWSIYSVAGLVILVALWMFSISTGFATLLLAVGALFALNAAVMQATSEFAVTNRRVIVKVGLVQRRSLDLNLSKVETVNVDQGIVGRLLDFGTITVIGTGGTREPFKNIANPMAFRLHVQEQIERRITGEQSAVVASSTPARAERECPHCAERILAKARVCKHCGRDVEPVSA